MQFSLLNQSVRPQNKGIIAVQSFAYMLIVSGNQIHMAPPLLTAIMSPKGRDHETLLT